ncbi:uncharacterized protein LOC120431605 isoform X2 [Culex pipiens pallens]|uniref:uncharacterized protein LOC120431605 isoform X2 n=1 Tax=Culex pipiens pallens TaxID=42434 RepID=UPI001953CCC3|nr:uncharacterized protein LOC120431605 isoform X2 [Culex pipiens pallens]
MPNNLSGHTLGRVQDVFQVLRESGLDLGALAKPRIHRMQIRHHARSNDPRIWRVLAGTTGSRALAGHATDSMLCCCCWRLAVLLLFLGGWTLAQTTLLADSRDQVCCFWSNSARVQNSYAGGTSLGY